MKYYNNFKNTVVKLNFKTAVTDTNVLLISEACTTTMMVLQTDLQNKNCGITMIN
jgi:hypothetical protein